MRVRVRMGVGRGSCVACCLRVFALVRGGNGAWSMRRGWELGRAWGCCAGEGKGGSGWAMRLEEVEGKEREGGGGVCDGWIVMTGYGFRTEVFCIHCGQGSFTCATIMIPQSEMMI